MATPIMTGLDRREFLAYASAMLVMQPSVQKRTEPAKLAPPPVPKQVPGAWLRAQTIPLWPDEPPGSAGYAAQALPAGWPPVFLRNVAAPELRVFRPSHPSGQALLVIPGGAYWFVSIANEGAEVAERLMAFGITLFVLTYRLPGEGWTQRADVPLQDAQRAMRIIRSQAARFGIDADSLSVLGFSAGGHLAATLATGHAEHVYDAVDAADRLSARPLAAGLVYPVITMSAPWTHDLSRKLLLGEAASDSEVTRRSAELHVDGTTPPIFIVHAMDDQSVPIENSLRVMAAMRAAKRPIEAHLLQEGGHGFGVGYAHSPSGYWTESYSAWLERMPARNLTAAATGDAALDESPI